MSNKMFLEGNSIPSHKNQQIVLPSHIGTQSITFYCLELRGFRETFCLTRPLFISHPLRKPFFVYEKSQFGSYLGYRYKTKTSEFTSSFTLNIVENRDGLIAFDKTKKLKSPTSSKITQIHLLSYSQSRNDVMLIVDSYY